MEYINWVLVPLGIFLASQFLLGPVLVYLNQKLPARYKFTLLASEPFLKERGDVFRELHAQIQDAGFRYVGSSELNMSHSSLYFSIYYSEERKLTCTLMTAHAAHQGPVTQIEFTQMYEDGTLFGVNNNGVFGVYPKWDVKEGYRFPHINDCSELLSITEKLIGQYKSNCVPKPLVSGHEFQTIEDHLNEEVQHLIDTGWVSPTPFEGEYRLTIKGAILMTWKMCWPIKGIINRMDVNRSIAALKGA